MKRLRLSVRQTPGVRRGRYKEHQQVYTVRLGHLVGICVIKDELRETGATSCNRTALYGVNGGCMSLKGHSACKLQLYQFIYILAGYPASLDVPIIHILCIIKLHEELIAEVSFTIVTARRRRNSASNRTNFDTITSIEHARWGHLWSRRLTDTASLR